MILKSLEKIDIPIALGSKGKLFQLKWKKITRENKIEIEKYEHISLHVRSLHIQEKYYIICHWKIEYPADM
jgi:hypothetical protein